MTSIGRRGKYIVCSLDTGDALMIHLRMSGRVLVSDRRRGASRSHARRAAPRRQPADRSCGSSTRERSARWWSSIPSMSTPNCRSSPRLGIDPITDGLTVPAARGCCWPRRARQLKPLLLDQHVIAGIGNIYCDEILHRAKLRPDRLANTLKPADVRRLHDAIHSILSTAIEAGGSTLSDTQYVDVMGDGGSFQLDHRVYDRAGQRCLTCGKATIVRIVSGGRSTCFCPRCQH